MKLQLIAETAFTHQGDFEYLVQQIDLAKRVGAQYVKFQVLVDIDSVYSKETALYADMSTKMHTWEEWEKAFAYVHEIGLKTLVLPIDYKALDLSLVSQYVDALEIHSICLNDVVYLDMINASKTDMLIVLGVGGRNLSDIDFCINHLQSENLLLMSGFQSFPTEKKNANLGKIRTLSTKYSFEVGYADHTPWDQDDSDMILASLSLGSSFIEKHIILKDGDDRADYYSAIGETGFKRVRAVMDNFSVIYGSDDLDNLNEKEVVYKERERKIIALKDISKGQKISNEDISYSVTDQKWDLEQKDYNVLIGKELKGEIKKGEVITSDLF